MRTAPGGTGADLSWEDREDALMRAAKGLYPHEAAVLLLGFHDTWLRRRDFAEHYIVLDDDGGANRFAWVEWSRAVAAMNDRDSGHPPLTASGSARRVLLVAASLGAGIPVDLSDAVSNLDDSNIRLVLAALSHARAGHERVAYPWPVRP